MAEESNSYDIIKNILSRHTKPSCDKEEIKAEIEEAIRGCDYSSAVIDYLWGAYSHGDLNGKIAFSEIFYDDVEESKRGEFHFFSFYFMNNFRRCGCDRRGSNERRMSYSLDYFSEQIHERRSGKERRQEKEKRLNWTRVTQWASVPFKVAEEPQKQDAVYEFLEEKMDELTILPMPSLTRKCDRLMNIIH